MGEVVNVVVAFAVIILIVRWATTSNGESTAEQAAARALRFKPKKVATVIGMFPDIPYANIHYDLLRTGSVELTTNKILERGFLDVPPEGYFTLYPHISSANAVPRPGTQAGVRPATTGGVQIRPKESLISRFGLESRLPAVDTVPSPEQDTGGRAVWEDTAEKREASLRERKAQMILAARQRMLAAQRIPTKQSTA
ncbi:hypothetical protein F5148DRAFT_1277098 [Russula earlei]|uniref:Uncharacterized protein n=1 Tax=Russula earlei TaxID=71964 RepID=A0ACC0U2D5_9AGAM|nr:hypothetical protein F5148DRAFT_1277098 [Russula earlei]